MNKAHAITHTAMLFAVAVVLSFMEGLLPPLPYLPPGFKLGLSNIATMYALFFLDKGKAFAIAVLKAFFVFVTRGVTSGILSLSGGIASLCVMLLAAALLGDKISYLMLSIIGAIFHNLGQLAVLTLIMQSGYALWYTPVLLTAGVIMGSVTGTLLRIVMPAFDRISGGTK